MVKLQLNIKAELDNVTDLVPASDDFEFFFEVKCNSCHEIHPKLVSVNRLQEHELKHGKGSTANFVWRCGNCRRESSASFEPVKLQPYSIDSNRQFALLLILDCRGLEFTRFDPQGVWTCKGAESGTVFSDVEFTDGEWTDYDEKSAQPVGISEIQSEWVRAP